MDLRIVKTRSSIREAFLELRAKYPLEKIKVTELCALAQINKTTFYKHYQDIYALSEEIEDETIVSIMGDFEFMDSLVTDPEEFMKGLYYTFKSHEELIMILFSGRMDILISKAERLLLVNYPQISSRAELEIMLSFVIWGASHVLMESKYEETVLLNTLTMATKQLLSFIEAENLATS